MLEINNLRKSFGSLCVTDGISLDIANGARHCVIGPNGAGKSTLVNLISGDLFPDSGSIQFEGKPITRLKSWERSQIGLTRTYQIATGYPEMSIAENMLIAMKRSDRIRQNTLTNRFDFAQHIESAVDLLRRTGIGADISTLAKNLSYGDVKQLELAMALATEPKLLILDEPLAGVGKDESARIVSIIKAIPRKITVVLIEHDMEAVFQIADTITVLLEGRELITAPPDQIRSNAAVRIAYLGND